MATSNKLDVSDLDFDTIKANLKVFLQNQAEFSDYDFEGSGMSVLLELLAYNTHYMSFNANMLANEVFLDTSAIRKNVVSHAKSLGYTPTSVRAPIADLDVTVNNVASGTSTLTMAKGTSFTATVNTVTYKYVTNETYTITPSAGVYKFSNIKIYEGTATTYNYTVDSTDEDQRFIIPSDKADTSTLVVTVQNSSSDTTSNTYTLATGITGLDSTSKVYFLNEGADGRFEIYFGDGVLGKSLSDGNIISLAYVVTNIFDGNGASSFTLSGSIGGYTDVDITVNDSANGAADSQTMQSVKHNAPLHYSAQDRAVTTKDYEALTKTIYPNAKSVRAYGGEDAEQPLYGTVYVAIHPESGSTLTTTTKNNIVSQLKKYNVGSVTPTIVTPEVTSILLTTNAKFNKESTTLSASEVKTLISDMIILYSADELQKFDSIFRYSKVLETINDSHDSILSNITTVKIRKEFTPTTGSATTYNVYFRNALYNPHSEHNKSAGGILSSTGFKITGNDSEMFLDDDGAGNVRLYYLDGTTRTYSNNTQGTINYSTGQVTLTSINIASISDIRGSTSTTIELTTTPNSNDIVPVRDQVLSIDVANSTITVEEDTFAGGTSDGGTTYTTTSSY